MTQRVFWTDAEVEILRLAYADQSNDDIARVLEMPRSRVLTKAKSIGLRKSETYIAALRSNWPKRTAAYGSYRIDHYGFLQRKISCEKGHHSRRWRSVHLMVWIEANGPIPPDHILVFKHGMHTNVLEEITLDRLECITKKEQLSRHTCNNYPPELRTIIRLRGELTKQINRRTEDGEEH